VYGSVCSVALIRLGLHRTGSRLSARTPPHASRPTDSRPAHLAWTSLLTQTTRAQARRFRENWAGDLDVGNGGHGRCTVRCVASLSARGQRSLVRPPLLRCSLFNCQYNACLNQAGQLGG
jgi:hypothetical protein